MARQSAYDEWIASEDVPIIGGYGIDDIRAVPRAPRARVGGLAAFIKLEGFQGETGMHVAEIPPGGALRPERHLYEEIVYVLDGKGRLTLRQPGDDAVTATLDWEQGGLFAIPLNAQHAFENRSTTEPALLLQFTNAPVVFDIFHSPEFVLGSDHRFPERFDGAPDFFTRGRRYVYEPENVFLWETNFVPNIADAVVDAEEKKGRGVKLTQCEMADGVLVSHIADWPVGSYHKGHYHGAGAVLLIVRGSGYSLMWPREAGSRPFEAGTADQVVRVDWRPGSVFSPPDEWFHQHFNTSAEPARQLAFRYGSRRHFVEFHDRKKGKGGPYRDIKRGGTMVEYVDEDPEIRQLFEAECRAVGTEITMPPVGSPELAPLAEVGAG
jgi:oxalate decarboxylase/phosphoglucose isomerase-like protein (cupin superfamily)